MKIFNKILILSLALVFCSCLKDLNTVPLNKTDFTSENAYENELFVLPRIIPINLFGKSGC